jgi:hypothetical protein
MLDSIGMAFTAPRLSLAPRSPLRSGSLALLLLLRR